MALKIKNFELPDGFILEEAYLKVQNILIQNIDIEQLETVTDSDDLITTWHTQIQSKANVYVFADHEARKNRVPPMEWFDIEFKLTENPFIDAYNKIKEIYPIAEDC